MQILLFIIYLIPVELYGAHIASTTYIPYSKLIIYDEIFESHIFTVQSADAEINVLGWKLFHFTLYTAKLCPLKLKNFYYNISFLILPRICS